MRISRLFFQTLREVPADAEVTSHQLMLRAGLVHPIAAGIFDYLPLGHRVKRKIEAIMRAEMDAIGGQEVTLPVVHPAELWQRSGRWDKIGDDLARFQDRGGRDYCLAMTHEEVMTDLAQAVVRSYRQLPFVLYQIQTKFRDEPRPRAGMIRVREFTMKDAYSFDKDFAGLDKFYAKCYQVYFNIFRRCGLEPIAVESDTGMMGGTMAHEFMALTSIGEDTLLLCDNCGYKANRQIATFRKPKPAQEAVAPLEEVHTPGINTIATLADFLEIPDGATAKAIFMVAEVKNADRTDADVALGEDGTAKTTREQFVFAVVRGDMDVNETKLANAVSALSLRPATPEEIRAIGAEPGYGSPIGVDRSRVLLVVDDLVAASTNLVAGANKVDTHFRNVNHARDYKADIVTDIVAAAAGYACSTCGESMRAVRGIEVGNIFKLGTEFSIPLGASYLDENGESHPIVMGSYGIGSGRLIASLIEHHHDEDGIRWPITVAPYQVALIGLGTQRAPEVIEAAEQVYRDLEAAGIDVLYDDRDERAGVKFNDADLLGIPIRLTLGGRGLKNGILEVKLRRNGEASEIQLANLVEGVQAIIDNEMALIQATLHEETLE